MVLSKELTIEQHMDKAFQAHDDSYNQQNASDLDRVMLLQEATFHIQVANYKMMRKVMTPQGIVFMDVEGKPIPTPLVGAS